MIQTSVSHVPSRSTLASDPHTSDASRSVDAVINSLIVGGVVLAGLSFLKDIHAFPFALLLVVLLFLGAAPPVARRYFGWVPLITFVAYLGLGVSWSQAPRQTVDALATLALETAAGVAVAVTPTPKAAASAVTRALKVLVLLSLVWGALLPAHGQMLAQGAHAWKGIFVHKNSLGLFAAFTCVIFHALLPRRRWLWLGLCYVLLVFAISRGPLVAAVAGLIAQSLAGRLYLASPGRTRAPSRFWFIAAIAAIGLVVNATARALISLLGKTTTLSHRTSVWHAVLTYAHPHWWFGSGLAAQIYPGSELWYQLMYATNEQLGTTQNGYLAILLAGGVTGCALFVFLLLSIFRMVDSCRDSPAMHADCRLAIGVIVVYCVGMFSEDIAFSRAGWFFLTFAIVRIFVSRTREASAADRSLSPTT